ncbi:ABC transporter ATP-binding protein [Xylanibacillus composti]|uniref:Dipeptide/oligopeptide/nickel ABC transporter ATP-binding protein n=1 Tax=Xylanibacillus composti TaxID=1572762 RepID=A0A8J4H3R9_9BACL|nr:dipeptide/oligopeptide/nickel ABC transporter ATP-binding protein [Xylanibacillus composti]MDT9723584.1 ABC transporter ATP-binding protein [Xylanibacillus composti]GIQ68379.1 dipeptide/oligopeptide/nickel ABC transporter ATP-binding protein [Xylanibacillus composti]
MSECLKVSHLSKRYARGRNDVAAVDRVSFVIRSGECVGLVGESGSGKSTLVRLLLALESPDHGEVIFQGRPLMRTNRRELRRLRQHIQVVFQDSTASLNDRLPVWRSVLEPLDNYVHVQPPFFHGARLSRREKAERLLSMVGLTAEHMDSYPHELSGGQRQRVCIARGISLCPQLLICDEPTSSLDVTTQCQILHLLQVLQRQLNMSVLFISHDLAAVVQLCHRLLVMRQGRIVDEFAADELWLDERHPYTKVLISASQ